MLFTARTAAATMICATTVARGSSCRPAVCSGLGHGRGGDDPLQQLRIAGTSEPVSLEAFVRQGPLFNTCVAAGQLDEAAWARRGGVLLAQLGLKPTNELTPAQAVRVWQYYLPLFQWMLTLVEQRNLERPLFIGLSCPQGGGKTTVVDALTSVFELEGRSCAVMSIDDFYLTHADQQRLAAAHPGNRLLELRGNPGTHDVQLALATLQALHDGQCDVALPRYDKSQHNGRGDRAPAETWPRLSRVPDVVLLEGWCLGFAAVPEGDLRDPDLRPVNQLLDGPYRDIHALMDAWVVLEIDSPDVVFQWREEAEAAMRAAGKPAMSPEQVADFITRYMPAYAQYLTNMYAQGPGGTDEAKARTLVVHIDNGRNPVSVR